METAIDRLDARKVEFDKDKAEYLKEFGGISDDLDRTLKIGAVTPEIGTMRKVLLAQKRIVGAAANLEDYKTAIPALMKLAERLSTIDHAKDRDDEQKAAWNQAYPAGRQRIAAIEDCGPINQALDMLKPDFELAIAEARAKALANDYATASKQLAAALVHTEALVP